MDKKDAFPKPHYRHLMDTGCNAPMKCSAQMTCFALRVRGPLRTPVTSREAQLFLLSYCLKTSALIGVPPPPILPPALVAHFLDQTVS